MLGKIKKIFIPIIVLMFCFCITGCGKADIPEPTGDKSTEVQTDKPRKGDTIAVFHIKDLGDIEVRLFKNAAPKAVENFVKHAKDGYYDGVIFHRVINDFMIQSGDPDGTGMGGESIWGGSFENEIVDNMLPIRGALCMANRGTSNSNGSQFFIVQAKSSNLDTVINGAMTQEQEAMFEEFGGTPHLVGKYTVFGQVTDGMDIVDKIAEAKTNGQDKPLEEIVISSIEIKEYGK